MTDTNSTISYPNINNTTNNSGGMNNFNNNNNEVEERKRKRRKKSKGWTAVFVVSLTAFLAAIIALVLILLSYLNGQKQYDDLKQYVDVSGKTLADFHINWDELRAINPDVVGWIYMPDTAISYPIVWKENDDQYYLTHNFNNKSADFGAEYGCIFMSGSNKNDWTDNSIFLFGHNMFNGTVFSTFSDNQGNSEWFNNHRTVYILTPQGNFRCSLFAQNKVHGTATDVVYTKFGTSEELQKYIDERKAKNLVTPDPAAPETSSIKQMINMSTCSAPDTENRIITYTTVEEFVAAGEKASENGAVIDGNIINSAETDAEKRKN